MHSQKLPVPESQMDCALQVHHHLGAWHAPLLQNEPRIHNPEVQAVLTRQHLLPVLPQLEACMLAVRQQLDPELKRLQPVKLNKPYPLGQCLEIAEAVQARLRTITGAQLPPNAAIGLSALQNFKRAGGSFRQVWGDLRGQYFQNAYQVGTLYIDVANDTVTPTKPKVEILPFQVAQFTPIRNFVHFRAIARSYWQHQVYPNHVLPQLAPHCPLIHVDTQGRIMFCEATVYMLALTRRQAFAPSVEVLQEEAMPPHVFEKACAVLKNAGYRLPRSAERGRLLALQQCHAQRAKRWHLEPSRVSKVIHQARQLNLKLAHWCQPTRPQHPPTLENTMSTIKIDNVEYALESLSEEARAQLKNIQFVDQELARLQAQVAAMQTARNAYVGALKGALPGGAV